MSQSIDASIDAMLSKHLQDIRAGHDGIMKREILIIIHQAIADELEAVAMDIKPYVGNGVTADLVKRVVELQG